MAMEVYAVTREFTEWGKGFYNRLPVPVRNGLRAAGVCHYLVVVRDPNKGEIYSFDFGPVGGDVTGRLAGGSRRSIDETPTDVIKSQLRKSQSEPSLATIAAIERAAVASADGGGGSAAGGAAAGRGAGGMRRSASTVRALSSARGKKPPTVGEIRERKLEALPEGVHFVGHSDLTLDDIRRFNAARCTNYSLHANDCRHYVDDLCAHACPDAAERYRRGVASRVSWQQTWGRVKSGRPHEALYVMPLQLMADVNNIPAINRIRSACSASFVFGLGMRAIPFLCKPVAPVAAALGVVKTPPARRIVTTAAGAVAGVSSEVPVVREALYVGNAVVGGVADVTRYAIAAGANLFSTSAAATAAATATAPSVFRTAFVPTAAVAAEGTATAAATASAASASAVRAAGDFAAGAAALAEGATASIAAGAAAGVVTASGATDAVGVMAAGMAVRGRETTNKVRNLAGRVGRATIAGLKRIASPVRLRERARQTRRTSPAKSMPRRRSASRGSSDGSSAGSSASTTATNSPMPSPRAHLAPRALRFLGSGSFARKTSAENLAAAATGGGR